MVVDYLYAFRSRFRPPETDSVLAVDSDAVLTPTVTLQGLEPIPRRNTEIVENPRRIDRVERARRYSTRHNTSLSQLVTHYLSQLDAPSESNVAPWVQRLRGILPSDTSVQDYRYHLEEKYS